MTDYNGYLTPKCKTCRHWLDDSWNYGCGRIDFENCIHLKPESTVEDSKQKQYTYNGPVMIFDRVIANEWHGKTKAVSERQARSNLVYQYKKQHHYILYTKISLPGHLSVIG